MTKEIKKEIKMQPEEFIKEASDMIKRVADGQKKINNRLDKLENTKVEIKLPNKKINSSSVDDFINKHFIWSGKMKYIEPIEDRLEYHDKCMLELVKFMKARGIFAIEVHLNKKF